MNDHLISILIPVFNREQIIIETLKSIRQQTYANWECIIIDDGSTDSTEKTVNGFVDRDQRFTFYKRPENVSKGANGCRNYGFLKATGYAVNWFDSDDIMSPNFLKEKVGHLLNGVDAVIHRNKYSNYELTVFRDSKFDYKNKFGLFNSYGLEKIELQTCCFLWKKEFLVDKKLFDPFINRYQDNEFHIRMLALVNTKFKVLDKVLATIRSGNGHSSQISHKQNVTKGKLWDVFYFRSQCIDLKYEHNIQTESFFDKTIGKKTLWAMYAALKLEQKPSIRRQDLKKRKSRLNQIYKLDSFSMIDVVKSKLYVLKLTIFK